MYSTESTWPEGRDYSRKSGDIPPLGMSAEFVHVTRKKESRDHFSIKFPGIIITVYITCKLKSANKLQKK